VTADVVTSSGRHAEPEWSREFFDPARQTVVSLGPKAVG